jgi:hypothetical protein
MLIDVDEFGISFEKCNRTTGWALRVFRVEKMGTITMVLRLQSFLQLSRGTQLFHRMSVGVFSVLGVGSVVSMELAQQSTSSGISVIVSAQR